jgi:ESCRT-I complex subunit VPS28
MDYPAALHRIQVGLPATVEHASEGGVETAQAVAETTQVCFHDSLHWVWREINNVEY